MSTANTRTHGLRTPGPRAPIMQWFQRSTSRGRSWGGLRAIGLVASLSFGPSAFGESSPDVSATVPVTAQVPAPANVTPRISDLELAHLNIPRLDGGVVVDGRLDEAQWKTAAKVTDYRMFEPVETGEAPDLTEAFVFYDAETLYLGFHCHSSKPGSIRAHISPREDINQDDQIGIYLDTYDDDRHAFIFYLNALGIQQDARYTEPGEWNLSWDAVIRSKGVVSSDGYRVEVAIPFRSLRFPNAAGQKWGLILTRKFAAEGVKVIWPKVTREKSNFIGQAAALDGIQGIASNRNLELQPTLVSQWVEDPQEQAGTLSSPLRLNLTDQISVAPGLTARYGVTSNLTLDAAINPDFSQVESDAGQLDANLRFALYYDERRPFFLEGTEAFGAPYLGLHSRSIVLPLAGLKLTGKEGPLTVGVLTAYDMKPQYSITFPTVYDTVAIPGTSEVVPDFTPGFHPLEMEGRGAQISVARVARDIGNGGAVGIMLADKEVVNPETGLWEGYHRYGAVDASLQLSQNDRLIAYLGSSLTGRSQDNPITLDDLGTEDTGDDLILTLPKTQQLGWAGLLLWTHSSRKFELDVTAAYESPNFRAETAYIPLVGYAYPTLYTHYIFEPKVPGLVFVRPSVYSSVFIDPVAEDKVAEYKVSPQIMTRFAGQNWAVINYSNIMERPYQQNLFAQWGQIGYESAMLNALSWSASYREGQRIYYPEDRVGYAYTPYLSVKVRPVKRFTLTTSFQRDVFVDSPLPSPALLAQKLSGAETPTPVYDQSVINLTANVNFTSAWSLRLTGRYNSREYGQVGASNGGLNAGALLAWLPYPGTAGYLGVSRGALWDQDGFAEDGQDWRVFFKFSYLWRV